MLRSPIYIDLTDHEQQTPLIMTSTKHHSLLIPPKPSTALTLSVLQSIFHPEPATLDLEFIKKCLSIPQLMDDYVVHSSPNPALHQKSITISSSNQSNSILSGSNPYKITIPKHLQMTRHNKNLPVYLQLEVPVLSRNNSNLLITPPTTRPIPPIKRPITPKSRPIPQTSRPITPTSRPITPTSRPITPPTISIPPTDSIQIILPDPHPATLFHSNIISKPPLKKIQSKPWK